MSFASDVSMMLRTQSIQGNPAVSPVPAVQKIGWGKSEGQGVPAVPKVQRVFLMQESAKNYVSSSRHARMAGAYRTQLTETRYKEEAAGIHVQQLGGLRTSLSQMQEPGVAQKYLNALNEIRESHLKSKTYQQKASIYVEDAKTESRQTEQPEAVDRVEPDREVEEEPVRRAAEDAPKAPVEVEREVSRPGTAQNDTAMGNVAATFSK